MSENVYINDTRCHKMYVNIMYRPTLLLCEINFENKINLDRKRKLNVDQS